MKTGIAVLGIFVAVLLSSGCTTQNVTGPNDVQASESFKVLYVSSYHTPWEWVDVQYSGFKEGLGNDLNVTYREFYLDTKRKSTEADKQEAGRQARELIDEWKPDLVYTSDDNAQKYVAVYYINSSTPFVFSAVNAEPEAYGFSGSTNNAGILEREHSVETVEFLLELDPSIKKIAVISDDDITWPPVIERMKKRFADELPGIEVVAWDIVPGFSDYQQKILEYESEADAVIHLGDFTYKYENGTNVPYDQAEMWAVQNSGIPDASFWDDRMHYGGLLAGVAISGYEQGKGAGIMARQILVDGMSPQSVGFAPTYKGQPVINLARARNLNITVPSNILLTAKVYDKFAWESA